MKRFLVRLLLFLLPVILFIAAWEYGLSHVQNSYKLKRAQLEAQAPKIEALVLGPSYVLRGVDPDYFSMRGYNLANVDQSIYYDTRITLNYLDKMPSLKVVLICISYPTLWSQTNDNREIFRDYFYADYWNIRSPNIKWYDIRIYSKILQYGNYKAWRFALKGFNVNLAPGYCDNGWAVKRGENAPINDSIAEALAAFHEKDFTKENYYDNVIDIVTLLKELNSRKIHPVFFAPPVTPSLYKYMKESRVRIMDSIVSSLCNAYHAKWYDYQNDSRFSDSDFKDVSHLNQDGAIKFSKIINEEILRQYTTTDSTTAYLKK